MKHFLQTLLTFILIIALGLASVFLLDYFVKGGDGSEANTINY